MSRATETKDGIEAIHAGDRKAWRKWLEKYATTKKSVFLIIYKKVSGKKSVDYAAAVEEALCFGWIDSKAVKRDEESVYQYMAKRKPNGVWSKVNKARIERLIANGSMTELGMQTIEAAKKNGSWSMLDDVEDLTIPTDLKQKLNENAIARSCFESYPASLKKQILHWIKFAKREETRAKRIHEVISFAEKNQRPTRWVYTAK